CDGGEHVHRSADGAPSHRRGVGNKVQRGGMEGLESQADHEGAGDGHRRAESRATFDERAKAESHQQQLQTAIRGDAPDGGLHDLEVSCADRDIVEIDSGNDNPHDVHQSGGDTVEKAFASQERRHMEHEDPNQDRSGGSGQRRPVRLYAQAGQQREQHNDGQRGDQRREPPMAVRVVVLSPDDRRQGQASSEGAAGELGFSLCCNYFFWRTKSSAKKMSSKRSLAIGKEIRWAWPGNVDWRTCKLKIAKELWRPSAISSSSS